MVPPGWVVEWFEAQASLTPAAPAVGWSGGELCYAELNASANRLARHLIGRGVGPERFVALAMTRSPDMVTALLAILKTGAGYLPVDVGYPAERIAFMLADASPALMLTDSAAAVGLPDSDGVTQIVLDAPDTAAQIAEEPDANPSDVDRAAPLTAAHAAYLIYTSGSTGAPKGVVVTHRNMANLVAWAASELGSQRLRRVLAATSLSFDVSVFEVFAPLVVGGTVEVVPDLLELADRPWSGTLISGVPSVFNTLPEEGLLEVTAELVAMAGEALTERVVTQVRASIPGCQVANLYGPTEATVYATGWFSGDGESGDPPIGRPLTNVRVYILDGGLRLLPTGVAGELYIAGAGVARGYLNQSRLTAQRFLPDPFGPAGSRMYHTGDRARWRADGQIEYLGRVDDQVKVRGFRIEIGEVEEALRRLPGVARAGAAVHPGPDGGGQIVGYLVAANRATLDLAELRERLSTVLPYYMVPATIMVLDTLPLTPSGKLDRRALPGPTAGQV